MRYISLSLREMMPKPAMNSSSRSRLSASSSARATSRAAQVESNSPRRPSHSDSLVAKSAMAAMFGAILPSASSAAAISRWSSPQSTALSSSAVSCTSSPTGSPCVPPDCVPAAPIACASASSTLTPAAPAACLASCAPKSRPSVATCSLRALSLLCQCLALSAASLNDRLNSSSWPQMSSSTERTLEIASSLVSSAARLSRSSERASSSLACISRRFARQVAASSSNSSKEALTVSACVPTRSTSARSFACPASLLAAAARDVSACRPAFAAPFNASPNAICASASLALRSLKAVPPAASRRACTCPTLTSAPLSKARALSSAPSAASSSVCSEARRDTSSAERPDLPLLPSAASACFSASAACEVADVLAASAFCESSAASRAALADAPFTSFAVASEERAESKEESAVVASFCAASRPLPPPSAAPAPFLPLMPAAEADAPAPKVRRPLETDEPPPDMAPDTSTRCPSSETVRKRCLPPKAVAVADSRESQTRVSLSAW
mmetsp:Transcript_40636/g.94185  ORF Transcript_40636/g.94185 Transcript_40636/m.94185 type:complete len:502 (+) Transcript_40636:788-2293(+)